MKHLTLEEMLDFVSLKEMNREAIQLCTVVNGHIRECKKCRQAVTAFQMIFDEFTAMHRSGNFKNFISEDAVEIEEIRQMLTAADAPAEIDACR